MSGAQSIETSIREGFTVVILRYQCLMPTSLQSARALSAIQASLYIQGNMWNIPFSVVIAALAKIAEGGTLPVIERFGRGVTALARTLRVLHGTAGFQVIRAACCSRSSMTDACSKPRENT